MNKLILYPICKKETEFIMPSKVTELSPYVFSKNMFLRKIKLSPSIEKIPEGTFYYCHSLQTINFPNLITQIDDKALYNCENLAIVYLPERLRSLGIKIFNNCDNLTDIYCKGPIPPNVTLKTFSGLKNYNQIRLWVPQGSREAYRSSNWRYFPNIIELGK